MTGPGRSINGFDGDNHRHLHTAIGIKNVGLLDVMVCTAKEATSQTIDMVN